MFYIPTFRGSIIPAPSTGIDYGAEWYTRVLDNGGTATSDQISAVNTFAKTLNDNGVLSKIARCNLFCGSNLSASLVPLVKTYGSASDVNHGFVDTDYNSYYGLTGDGSSKYLDTGLNSRTSSMSINDYHLSTYLQAASVSGSTSNKVQIGNFIGGGTLTYYMLSIGSSNVNDSVYYSGHNVAREMSWYKVDSDPVGCYIGSRIADNSSSLYRNGVLVATASIQSRISLPNCNIYVFVGNDTIVTPYGYFDGCLRGYTIGTGLSNSDISILNNAYTTYVNTMRFVTSSPTMFALNFLSGSTYADTGPYNIPITMSKATVTSSIGPWAGSGYINLTDNGGYLKVSNHPALYISKSQEFTLEMYINMAYIGWYQRTFGMLGNTYGQYSSVFDLGAPGVYIIGGGRGIASSKAWSINTWYHIAIMRYSGSIIKYYVNGLPQTGSITNIGGSMGSANAPFYLGIDDNTATGGQTTNANTKYASVRLSNVAVYPTASFTPPTTLI